ncbi:uncharacterized protein LOC124887725 [Capsicum annuum]|uniref:uncharacterized protein LOC124887725 n=1 Tax=Capsicum annuum TaxID=4072 RepID=UPI001FB10721|nr:uncharacterized protein LOC124887725 [Capsicum annuum]
MKDLITKKRAFSYDPVDNVHHCSAVATRSLVEKKKDPNAFTIPCTIGSFNFVHVLYVLGASIELMPFMVIFNVCKSMRQPDELRVIYVINVYDEEVDSFHDVDAVTLWDDGFDAAVPI